MPIKPSPTIAGKLRKLFNNNKQTIEPAIGDSVPGGSANVLTLYLGYKGTYPNGMDWAYKNPERTEEYESYSEAETAVKNADIIKIVDAIGSYFPVSVVSSAGKVRVFCAQVTAGEQSASAEYFGAYLCDEDAGLK